LLQREDAILGHVTVAVYSMVPTYIRMHAYTYHTYVALYPYHIGCIHTLCMHVAYMDAATVCMAHTHMCTYMVCTTCVTL